MTRRLVAIALVVCCLALPGCVLDKLFPEPAPDCPYPQFVCDLLDDVGSSDLGESVQCVRDCFED